MDWWENREENGQAWRVPVERIIENGFNLDIKNPASKQDFEHMPPEQLVKDIVIKEQRILEIMGKIREVLGKGI